MSAALAIESTLREVVRLLVAGEYLLLEQLSRGTRLTAAEIEAGVSEFGRQLVFPPQDAFSEVDVVPIRNSSPPEYSIRFHLYTAGEGQSDLELQATFIEAPSEEFMRVEIDNILVA